MSNSSSTGGIGFLGGLQLLFIGLKLGNVIQWSWWWVFSPIWIPTVLVLGICTLVVCFGRKRKNTWNSSHQEQPKWPFK